MEIVTKVEKARKKTNELRVSRENARVTLVYAKEDAAVESAPWSVSAFESSKRDHEKLDNEVKVADNLLMV